VTKKKEIVEKYQKDMEAMIALDTHEDEIRLCAAKLYWSDVAEAEAVVRELQAKNAKLQNDFHKAEKELSIATSRKDTLGDSASLSNVSHPTSAIESNDLPTHRHSKIFIKKRKLCNENTIPSITN
jgi:glutamate-1-semialdehyde aminotransferase